jgi:predicted DCC family thiol-disulfide oxidoreductase YuxK
MVNSRAVLRLVKGGVPKYGMMERADMNHSTSQRDLVLFDGHCRFCRAAAEKLVRLARPGSVELLSFHEPGALDRHPGLTHDACMRQIHLVTADGRVFVGMEAVARAVSTRFLIGWLAYFYYVPGLRQIADLGYRWIAANRYRFMGRIQPADCADGACALHDASQPRHH